MDDFDSDIRALTETLFNELTKAMAFPPRIGRIIRPFFTKAAWRFAEIGVRLDRIVAEQGVAAGARWVLPRFVKDYAARGVENIPPAGPLVVAANHPAAYDSVVISAHVNRPDYKIIIGDIPFFEHLPHVSERAFYAPDPKNLAGRMKVVREAIRHLKDGGALLIFPRGGIEPDPDFMLHADDEFDHWSRSLEIFLKRAPQAQVLVTIVSGVISRAAMRHPITWLRRNRPDRQRLAFMYQIIRQMLSGKEIFGLSPRVTFGDHIDLNTVSGPEHALEAIISSARRTLASHIAWQV